MHHAVPFLALAVAIVRANAAEVAVIDRGGKLQALAAAGRYIEVSSDIRVPAKGWGRMAGWGEARDVKVTSDRGVRTWSGVIQVNAGQEARLDQKLQEREGAAVLDFSVTALTDLDTEGAIVWLDVPIEQFKGGAAGITNEGARVKGATLPLERAAVRHFLAGEGDGLRLAAPDGSAIEAMLSRAIPITVQDTREWQGATYQAFMQLAPTLRRGETTTLRMTLRPEPRAGDDAPAALRMDAARPRYRLQGIGGNYCFDIESPITQHTLSTLDVGWARTELSLSLWEPHNDNASAAETDWAALEAADQPGSRIRRELELARQIQTKGIPYTCSVWRLPDWLYASTASEYGRVVPLDRWAEMAECVGSYLAYAKRKYGVEPGLFMFNEPDYGVQVKLTPEEHRDVIKLLGAHFARLGLKTKLLLGDVTNGRGTHVYCEATAADPDAMRYVGAVAFHSWGGASPEQYGAWSALARRLRLPLLVSELGVDAGAWQTSAFDTYHYALREMRHYQEVLLYACPQGTMQWEFTGDYGVMGQRSGQDGKAELVPTARYWLVKHFCNLTPRNSDALTTTSDQPDVLFTAFAGPLRQGRRDYALHIVNLGGRRRATVSGIPAGIEQLRIVRTGEAEGYREAGTVRVAGGRVTLTLEGSGMVTMVPARK